MPRVGASGTARSAPDTRIAQPQLPAREVGAEAQLVEVHPHLALARRGGDQHAVELAAADRVDHLVRALPVGLQRRRSAGLVHHAAAHRDEQRGDLAGEAGGSRALRPRAASARLIERPRSGELWRGSGRRSYRRHREAAAREQERQERSGQARADDVDLGRAHALSTSVSVVAKRQASSKLL